MDGKQELICQFIDNRKDYNTLVGDTIYAGSAVSAGGEGCFQCGPCTAGDMPCVQVDDR